MIKFNGFNLGYMSQFEVGLLFLNFSETVRKNVDKYYIVRLFIVSCFPMTIVKSTSSFVPVL